MKVRDLRQYIKAISKGNETLELVGSNREYFFEYDEWSRTES